MKVMRATAAGLPMAEGAIGRMKQLDCGGGRCSELDRERGA